MPRSPSSLRARVSRSVRAPMVVMAEILRSDLDAQDPFEDVDGDGWAAGGAPAVQREGDRLGGVDRHPAGLVLADGRVWDVVAVVEVLGAGVDAERLALEGDHRHAAVVGQGERSDLHAAHRELAVGDDQPGQPQLDRGVVQLQPRGGRAADAQAAEGGGEPADAPGPGQWARPTAARSSLGPSRGWAIRSGSSGSPKVAARSWRPSPARPSTASGQRGPVGPTIARSTAWATRSEPTATSSRCPRSSALAAIAPARSTGRATAASATTPERARARRSSVRSRRAAAGSPIR